MKHQLTTILFLIFCITICKAQTKEASRNNAVSFEIGKTGLIYNLTFDHKLRETNLGFRINVGSNFAKYLKAFSTGGGGYYLVGQKKNHLELGVDVNYLVVDKTSEDQKGFALVYPNYSVKTIYASMNIGYRKYGQRTLFRIGISPGFIQDEFLPGGYISYGITF